jgi:(p)ppGpp synthase/HD superfamily hydrolase
VRRPTRSRRCGTGERSSSNTKLAAYTSTEADPSAVDPGPDGNWSHVDADFLYRSIEDKLAYLSDYERSEVHDATRMAFNAHDGQRRKSGEPFVTHPVAVAGILADQRMDHETVIAGLLHDTVEDTEYVTFESIQTRFGPAVRRIVEGETKVSKVSSSVSKQGTQAAASTAGGASGLAMGPMGPMAATPTPEQALAAAANVQADDLKEMFLAMTQDVRVIIVKLADRLHNMRTLGALKPEKRVKIARETLLVFAPLAKLLGMYNVKNELEELAFRYAAPETYAETARWFDELSKRQDPVVRRAQQELQELCDKDEFLKQACDRVEVLPRAKEFYGLFR